eukprot:CAMPEP_0119336096 /NCGR_PEP_ID=MMETSP1333-20130426/91135_1 /TAXON_ID=418940 /ORGANISM="Scyphosphaera apsteinii, Strain RCC1455" /LENGTH=67 /DNA_ID=CAMNT_0007346823 /DNA_START=349 /DNA_END=553 /DNA_ORIENTATION=+
MSPPRAFASYDVIIDDAVSAFAKQKLSEAQTSARVAGSLSQRLYVASTALVDGADIEANTAFAMSTM